MSASSQTSAAAPYRVAGLISLAHGCSHFYQLVLPPLFPLLVASHFAPGYTELGMVMTLFFVTSGASQVAAGFLVDRFGALKVLRLGLAIYSLAIFGFAMAPAFWMFYPLAMLIGFGNSVFHPADFTLMNANLEAKTLGRAFGFHTLGGNIGWALAPGFMLGLSYVLGWRGALIAAAAIGTVIVLMLVWQTKLFAAEAGGGGGHGSGSAGRRTGLAAIVSWPVVGCFVYFALLALSLIAVQNFLPPTLAAIHGTALTVGNTALTGYLIGASMGVLAGGFMADHWGRYGLTIGLGLSGAAAIFLGIGGFDLSLAGLIAGTGAAGFLTGMTTPSRDLLVRSATPPGATGRVFGFVYSGLDVGSACAPISIGILLDSGHAEWVFRLLAVTLLLAITTAVAVRPQRAVG